MGQQLLENDAALRLFFTDPIFIAADNPSIAAKNAGNASQETNQENTINPDQPNTVTSEPTNLPVTPNFTFMGGNAQHILVLVNDASHSVSTPEGAELLRNILKFMQLKTADFALVNYANNTDATFTELQEFFQPKLMLGFGIDPKKMGIDDANENTATTLNGCVILLAKDLPTISADNNEKRTFLTALKTAI